MENLPRPRPLTAKDFFQLEQCQCGKNLFRYHNTSKNEFIAKCGIPKEEYDLKSMKWTLSKKQPCSSFYAYYGERPVFEEIKNVLIRRARTVAPDKDRVLEEKLRLLFQFATVSNHSSTLDEINILVRKSLKKDPRKVSETLEEYRKRVFTEKIVDMDLFEEPVEVFKPVVYISHPVLERNKKIKAKRPAKQKKISSFIVVPDDENEATENGEESDRESDSERELSDYDDTEPEVIEDLEEVLEEPEELGDDYDDECGEFSDYN